MSSELDEIVSITITTDTVGLARAGFGVPLVLSCNATFPERVRFYSKASDCVSDGFTTTSPEYRALAAIFRQSPKPKQACIGRAVGKPTLLYALHITNVINNHPYVVNVDGDNTNLVPATASYTSDGSATNDEIATGIVAALQAVPGKNYTAATTGSNGSLSVTVTATVAGGWFSLESTEPGNVKIAMTHSEPGTTLASDLDAINLEQPGWYGLVTLYNSNAYVLAAAAWIEGQTKLYIPDLNESETATLAVGGSDTADDLRLLGYRRTAAAWHPRPAQMMAAAWFGRVFPIAPGKDNWAFKPLAGVSPATTTSTYRVNLKAKNASWYRTIGPLPMTWKGNVANGDWLDNTRGVDWFEDRLATGVFNVLYVNERVDYDNDGRNALLSECEAAVAEAIERKIARNDGLATVTAPKAEDQDQTERANRNFPDIEIFFNLDGAINTVGVSATVSV